MDGGAVATSNRKPRLDAYVLPAATAAFGIAGTVLGLLSVPIGAAVAVSGAIVVASFDVVSRMRAEGEARAAESRALERLAEAARAFQNQLRSGMPLGGTTVPDGTVAERLVGMAQQLRAGQFTFLKGRRWSDWSWVGTALTTGRQELLVAAGLAGGRLPHNEEARVRAFATLLQTAARHAFEISSLYAGYDVTEEPRLPRYMPEDREVGDVTAIDSYSAFATEFNEILADLDRTARLAP